MKLIELPPYAPTLIESTRAIGYSLEAAMADIVDNSIAAKATKVDIYFFPVDDEYVAILDNGNGMDEVSINKAMQYGSKSPIEERDKFDLGRFGLGLKTASLSQCRSLTVISKQGDVLFGRRWDIDYVIESGTWSLIALEKDEIESAPEINSLMQYESGTLVVWQKLDRMKTGEIDFEKSLGRKMDEVRNHLSLVYHRYLSGENGIKRLAISLNGVSISPADPFLAKKSTQAMDDEVIIVRGKQITVRPYILPHITKMTEEEKNALGGKDGLRKQQGFYIYRNKRLLVWGTWFRMMRKYRFLIFTDAELSTTIKTLDTINVRGIPTECQIWDMERLFRVCSSDLGRLKIEIDFRDYVDDGIPCLEASSAATADYNSYLCIIPGEVLADIYDKYGSQLLEGNVRSFLSTKVAVNKKIRETILKCPSMFFAFNNGISATAMNVEVADTRSGKVIIRAQDFQIINGGQTTGTEFPCLERIAQDKYIYRCVKDPKHYLFTVKL